MVYYRYFPQNTIKIHDTSVVQNLEGIGRPVTLRDVAEKLEAINTLPSKYHPSEFDRGPYFREETWMEFVKWRMMGEEDQTIEYIKAPESVGIMIPAKGRYSPVNVGGLTINDSFIELNMRDVGKYLSLEYNFRQHLIDYMRGSEGQQLAAFLNKSGFKAEDISYVAIGFVPDQAIYAIGRLPNGKVVIYASKDSYKKITDEAEVFGMNEDEFREAAIGEEIAHNFRKSYDGLIGRIQEERETKETLLEFYKTLAKTTSNTKLQEKYARIIGILEHDISTVSRYAKIHSDSLQDLVGLYCSDIGELVSVLEAKALYEGINTKKGIEKYVSEKLGRIKEAAERECTIEDRVTDEELSDGSEVTEEAEACAEAGIESDDGGDCGEE